MDVENLAIVKCVGWIYDHVDDLTGDMPSVFRGLIIVLIIAALFAFMFITFKAWGYMSLIVIVVVWLAIELLHWIGGGHN